MNLPTPKRVERMITPEIKCCDEDILLPSERARGRHRVLRVAHVEMDQSVLSIGTVRCSYAELDLNGLEL